MCQGYHGTVYTFEPYYLHLVIDPSWPSTSVLCSFYCLHSWLLCTQIATYWRNQGGAKGIQKRSTLLNHTIYTYDGQGNQLSHGHRSIVGLPSVYTACFIVGHISCCVLK
jgi:hypothetical protein